MSILSVLSIATSFLCFMVLYRRMSANKDLLNLFSLLVCGCLGWWSFCDGFFYIAATKEIAWFWHNLSSVGWCGFVGVTAYYFLILTGVDKKLNLPVKILYWGITVGLTLRFVFFRPTALAVDLVQSASGLGWTFAVSFNNIWMFIFLLYLVVFFGGSLFHMFLWQRNEAEHSKRHLAVGFVILDISAVAFGFISILVLPFFTDFLPPLGFVALLIFLWGYCHELWEYDLSSIDLIINPKDIFDTSQDAMVITDLNFKIFYANKAAQFLLLGRFDASPQYITDFLGKSTIDIFTEFLNSGKKELKELTFRLPNNMAVTASIHRINTRRDKQRFMVISMHDISRIKDEQEQVAHMAYYDDLTGLQNRRRLGELLEQWKVKSLEDGSDFALYFFDLNHFKTVNDRYGHDCGDKALIAVADAIRRVIRPGDEGFRLSGDEFIILRRITSAEDTANLAFLLRKAVQNISTNSFAPGFAMDVSVGICLYSEYKNTQIMLKTADERMYKMKDEIYITES